MSMNQPQAQARATRNIRAEEAIIGKIIGSAETYWRVSDYLTADQFVVPHHRLIFAAVAECCLESAGPGLSLLESKLPVEFEGVGAVEAVLQLLIEKAFDVHSPLDFVDDVILAWRERERIELAKIAAAPNKSFDETRSAIEERLRRVDDFDRARHAVQIGQAARSAVERSAEAYEHKDRRAIGVLTKVAEVDKVIGPQIEGTSIILAAPSGHGKSGLLSQILRNNAAPSLDPSSVFPSLLLSLEMSRDQVAHRDLASLTGISVRKQISGDFTQQEFEELRRARAVLDTMPIHIQDRSRMTTKQIGAECRSAVRRHGVRQIGLDHLKLIEPEKEHWNLVRTIEYATAYFKDLAKELGVVIWQLAQITRGGQQAGGNWRFRDTDIYGGGLVVENSDVAIGFVIPKVWLRANKPEAPAAGEEDPKRRIIFDSWLKNMNYWDGKAEFCAFKVRSGPGETWRELAFDGPRMLFGDVVEDVSIPF
jgi:replicative DNA helicase